MIISSYHCKEIIADASLQVWGMSDVARVCSEQIVMAFICNLCQGALNVNKCSDHGLVGRDIASCVRGPGFDSR